jgi:hypothetical protein
MFGQTVPPAKEPINLTNQNPPVVPNAFELGRRAGITEEDHTKLAKLEDRVDDIRSTISWMRGAWWALGAAIALIVIVVKFFGSSVLVAIEHRLEKARSNATGKNS